MRFDIKEMIYNSLWYNTLKRVAKGIVLPGFDHMPLFDVMKFFWEGIQKGAITVRASAVAYNFFLAIFPMIIFLFTIIPYIPIPQFDVKLLEILHNFIPQSAYNAVQSTIEDIVKQPRGGLLSLGFVMALFFSTNGINSLINAFNSTYHTIEPRSAFKQRLISIFLVFIILILMIVTMALISFNDHVIFYLIKKNIIMGGYVYYLIIIGKWLILIGLMFFTTSFLYYLGPSKTEQYRFISPGSTLTTLLMILSIVGFNFYINNFSTYNALYGSIGTLIIVLMWIYFIALIVLIGFELNSSITNAKRKAMKEFMAERQIS